MPVPRDELTDYLLNELPAGRRAEVETLLREDPAARAELDSLRGLVGALQGLPSEDVPRPPAVHPIAGGAAGAHPTARGLRLPALPRRTAATAVAVAAAAVAIWASPPQLSVSPQEGWTLTFGDSRDARAHYQVAALREELEASEARWQRALQATASRSAGERDRLQAALAAVRSELDQVLEDAAAGYEFLNAKHELLKRQLLEFDLASASEVRP